MMLHLFLAFALLLLLFLCGGSLALAISYFLQLPTLYISPFFFIFCAIVFFISAFYAGYFRGANGFKTGFLFGLFCYCLFMAALIWFAPVLLTFSLCSKSFLFMILISILAEILGVNVAQIAAAQQKKE